MKAQPVTPTRTWMPLALGLVAVAVAIGIGVAVTRPDSTPSSAMGPTMMSDQGFAVIGFEEPVPVAH